MNTDDMKSFLDERYAYYETNFDVSVDPLSIPSRFTKQADIEISGFFAAMFAWGNRKAILKSCNHLMTLMDNAPFDFVLNHQEADLKPLLSFVYRTFNSTDLLYFIAFFNMHYSNYASLEDAFLVETDFTMKDSLSQFHDYFFSLEYAPDRTRKHVSSPKKQSACKRLNMYLRWMVRQHSSVDFGLWHRISSADLICPLDIHVSTVSRKLGLLERKQDDWKAAVQLTSNLKAFDALDPVKYDLVLFSLGAERIPF